MESEELQACKDALSEIIEKCDTFRGLADSYKEKQEDPALDAGAEESPEHELTESPAEESAEPVDSEADDEPPPISFVERPGARQAPRPSAPAHVPPPKRGRGRPRKNGF